MTFQPLPPPPSAAEARSARYFEAEDLLRYARIHLILRVVIGVAALVLVTVLLLQGQPRLPGLGILLSWLGGSLVLWWLANPGNIRQLAGWAIAWDLLGCTAGILADFDTAYTALYFFPYVIIATVAAAYYGGWGLAVTGAAGTLIYLAMLVAIPTVDPLQVWPVLGIGAGIMILTGGVLSLAERARYRGYQDRARAATAHVAEQERDLLAGLFAAGQALAEAPDEASLVAEAARAAGTVVSADLVGVLAYDPGRDLLLPRALHGRVPPAVPISWPADRGILGHVVRTRRPYLAADTSTDPYFQEGIGPFGAELALPVLAGETLLGVLDVNRDQAGGFTDGEVRALQLYVGLLAASWKDQRDQAAVAREQARRDRMGRLALDLLAATSEDRLREAAISALRDLLPVVYVAIWLIEGDEVVADARWQTEPLGPQRARLSLARTVNLRRCLAENRALVMSDPNLPAGRAAIGPMKGRSQDLGAVTVVLGPEASWTPEDLLLLEGVASSLALRTENLRLQQEASAQAQRILRLNDFTRALTATLELERVAESVATALRPLVPFDALALHVRDRRGQLHTILRGAQDPPGDGLAALGPEDPVWDRLLRAADPMEASPEAVERLDEELLARGCRSHLTLPLVVGQQAVGALSLLSAEAGRYGMAVLQELKPLAEQLAIAVANARLYLQVQEQARSLERMGRLTAIARSSLDLNDILPAFVHELEVAVPSLRNVGFVIVQEGGGYRIVTSARAEKAYARGRQTDHPQPATEEALRTRRPVFLSGEVLLAQAPPGAVAWLQANHIRATVHYPLISAGRPVGAAILASSDPADLAPELVEELAPALDQFATAVDHALTFEESQRNLMRRSALADAAAALNADLDLRISFIPFMDAIAKVIPVQGASILMVKGLQVTRFGGWGLVGPAAPSEGRVMSPDNPLLAGRTDYAELAASPYSTDQYYYEIGLRYRVALPLVTEDGLVGVWALFRTSRAFTPAEVSLVQQAAAQLATVLTNSRLFLETREARDRVEAYARIAAMVNATVALEDVFDDLVREARRILPFDGFRLLDLEQADGTVTYRRVLHPREARPSRAQPGDPLTSAVARRAIETGRAVIRPTVSTGEDPATVPAGVASTMLVPISSKGSTVGLLIISSRREHAFGEESVKLVEPIAGFLAAELERARAFADMERSALTDALTGVANRRLFEELLAGEFHRSRRQGLPLSVMMLDLDRFKQVNDQYGHLVGDQLLRQVTAALQECLRRSDRLARLGGDEFVALLPETDGAGALEVARKLIARVEEDGWDLGGDIRDVRVGLSAGIASLAPGEPGPETPTALLDAADQALYEAKRAGRGRAVMAS